MRRTRGALTIALLLAWGVGCGARTELNRDVDGSAHEPPMPTPEVCNRLDDDLDGDVDEDFRDELGRYIADAHCGGCGRACAPGAHATAASCTLLSDTPTCVATACEAGYAISTGGDCVDPFDHLCRRCVEDADCGSVPGARCADVGSERRCVSDCDPACPSGYRCEGDACVPEGGSCSCEPGDAFTLACDLMTPDGEACVGAARCTDGALSECAPFDEVCDHADNDCDGAIDDGFMDERGAYSLDIHNCGECGVDCTLSAVPEGDLICGGDPFAPSCVLACPDAADGLDPGDRIDADRDIATGCECRLSSLTDVPGPVGAVGQELDVNCDGADGVVTESFYVATGGDDMGPGSPTRPLATIDAALARAAASLDTDTPRPHVFVASGAYTETLHLPDGVQLHGGYRPDFLALDPSGFRVDVRAPADTDAPGGAVLVAEGAGARETVVEWIELYGRDATAASSASFGALLRDPGANLTLRDLGLHGGAAGAGHAGTDGRTGEPVTVTGAEGSAPKGAMENGSHDCQNGPENVNRGGAGGSNLCGDVDTSGGAGGSARCPTFAEFQGNGAPGSSTPSVSGGAGGRGGQDSTGPITGPPCSTAVCCGLADFTVPTTFSGPAEGQPGRDGVAGEAGSGCGEAFGRFVDEEWRPARATAGTDATPGSGGGGGGAGGGVAMDWMASVCEFADGLGGGGGGGGAGGCGGRGGRPGTSGGPSVALLIRYTTPSAALPSLSGVRFLPSDGGRGGDGGAGGDGGLGGAGGQGGALLRSERTTPTLSAPFPGARGGQGGKGGAGGGGGGGCGGASVGVWVVGLGSEPAGVARWRGDNRFTLGAGGRAGAGGAGGAPGGAGAAGGAIDVIVR